jgi:cellulose biosynthesis protein BcsQ
MSERPRKFAFVSGKGGVGKTLLAANFSFYSSTNRKTVLIDLDFQNQGASGLLAQHVQPGCMNAFDLLATGSVDIKVLVRVRDNLFFIPAFDPSKGDRFASQPASSSFQSKGVESLVRVVDQLIEAGNFEAVIIDCHGGLDDSSFAAFIYSDTTFIVTEPDKVTFGGTLELLDFYVDRANAMNIARLADRSPGTKLPLENSIIQRIAHIEDNKIKFLVNRVSGKFGYRTLKDVLSRQFDANLDILQKMNRDFLFLPNDPTLSESFSEFPFFVELLPEAVFSQKIESLCYQSFGTAPIIKGRTFLYRIFERISPSKIDAFLKSPSETRVQAVFSFVALMQLLFSVLFIGAIVVGTNSAYVDSLAQGKSDKEIASAVSVWMLPYLGYVGICLTIFLLYLIRFNLLISGFFRDRLRYEWRLYSRGYRQPSIVFTLRIIRAFSFRFVLVLWAWVCFFAAVLYGFSSVELLTTEM